MPRLLKTELPHQRRAFECYYAMGGKRTYARVSAEVGVDVSTVKLWGRSFSWTQRIRERDIKAARQIADRALQEGLGDSERNLKIVRVALVRLAKGIADGNVKMQLGDLERLIRLEHQLVHGPDTQTGAEGGPEHGGVLIYLPDNGRDPLVEPPQPGQPVRPVFRCRADDPETTRECRRGGDNPQCHGY